MPEPEALGYARLLAAEAREFRFDPLTGVAIIHHESGWNPRAVSPNGEDFGLAQVRARYIGACRKDADPVGDPSPECRRVKEQLLDPERNIHQMALAIQQNRALCREKTGNASFPRWLASYQGLNRPKAKRWCRPSQHTWRVIAFRERLVRAATRATPRKGGAGRKRPKTEP